VYNIKQEKQNRDPFEYDYNEGNREHDRKIVNNMGLGKRW